MDKAALLTDAIIDAVYHEIDIAYTKATGGASIGQTAGRELARTAIIALYHELTKLPPKKERPTGRLRDSGAPTYTVPEQRRQPGEYVMRDGLPERVETPKARKEYQALKLDKGPGP